MNAALNKYQVAISGGTGSLGQEVVSEFIRRGAAVFTNYRSADKFNRLKSAVSDPEKLSGVEADLTTEEGATDFFRQFGNRFQRLDAYLHLMGGFWMGGAIAQTAAEDWQRMLDMNLNSTFFCVRQAFNIQQKQCSGKIFTVAAKAALDLPTQMGAYAVSKAAVLALTEILAKEGQPFNIQVNAILPSVIDSEANQKAMPDADFSDWVKPRDIARLLADLCRPENSVLSQTALKVYGRL